MQFLQDLWDHYNKPVEPVVSEIEFWNNRFGYTAEQVRRISIEGKIVDVSKENAEVHPQPNFKEGRRRGWSFGETCDRIQGYVSGKHCSQRCAFDARKGREYTIFVLSDRPSIEEVERRGFKVKLYRRGVSELTDRYLIEWN